MSEWLSAVEVAERLHLSREFVSRMAKRGKFPGAYLGGVYPGGPRWQIPADALEALNHQSVERAPKVVFEDVVGDAEWLARTGAPPHEAAKRLGYSSWETLQRALYRNGRNDLASGFSRNSHQPARRAST